jgi:uncharacterized protein DUF5666
MKMRTGTGRRGTWRAQRRSRYDRVDQETTFVLDTKQSELTVTTSAGTNYHSPRLIREAGGEHLTFAVLKVGQRVAVQGERQDGATLFAQRVHIPKP